MFNGLSKDTCLVRTANRPGLVKTMFFERFLWLKELDAVLEFQILMSDFESVVADLEKYKVEYFLTFRYDPKQGAGTQEVYIGYVPWADTYYTQKSYSVEANQDIFSATSTENEFLLKTKFGL